MKCTKINHNDWSKQKLLYALWSETSKNEQDEPTLNEIEDIATLEYIDTFKNSRIGVDISNWPNVDHYWYDNYNGEDSFKKVLDKLDVYSRKYNDKILYFVSEQLHVDLNKFIKKRKTENTAKSKNKNCTVKSRSYAMIFAVTMFAVVCGYLWH